MKKIILCTAIVISSVCLQAQDPHFSHINNSEWYFNPAMVNNDSMDHVGVKYRNQWPALSGNYVTSTVHYAHYFSKTNGAVYGGFMNDVAGNGTLTSNRLNLGYAQKLKLGRDLMLQLGLELAYGQRILDWDKLTFGDMIDPRRGFIYESGQVPTCNTGSYFDLSSGALLTYKKAFLGFSVHHIPEPNESVICGDSPLPRKYGVQAGYELQISGAFSAAIKGFHYRQAGFRNNWFGGELRYQNQFSLGYYHRLDDAHIITAGYIGEILSVFYSLDITHSQLSSANLHSHEISTSIRFWSKAPHPNFIKW